MFRTIILKFYKDFKGSIADFVPEYRTAVLNYTTLKFKSVVIDDTIYSFDFGFGYEYGSIYGYL